MLRTPRICVIRLQALCERESLLGTVLVAREGFNGTLAGARASIESVFAWLEGTLSLARAACRCPLDRRDGGTVFAACRVRVKKEIVTLGRPDILPHRNSGEYVSPEDWNRLIEDPDVLVIDHAQSLRSRGWNIPAGD